jgi:hypothetical protein
VERFNPAVGSLGDDYLDPQPRDGPERWAWVCCMWPVPDPRCRGPAALANERAGTRNGLTYRASWNRLPPGGSRPRPAGRATGVPYRAGASGTQRTVTVTSMRPVDWTHGSDLGWKGKAKLHGMQAVMAGIDLGVPGRPIRSLVAEGRSAGGVRDQTGPDPRSVLGPQPNGELRTTAGKSGK